MTGRIVLQPSVCWLSWVSGDACSRRARPLRTGAAGGVLKQRIAGGIVASQPDLAVEDVQSASDVRPTPQGMRRRRPSL